MAQNFKKAVQNALLMPRKKQYEKDYIRLLKEYEDQSLAVFNYVSSKEVEEETAKRQIGNHHQRHGDHWQAVKQSLQERCVEDV